MTQNNIVTNSLINNDEGNTSDDLSHHSRQSKLDLAFPSRVDIQTLGLPKLSDRDIIRINKVLQSIDKETISIQLNQ